jgi:hypothetical protein
MRLAVDENRSSDDVLAAGVTMRPHVVTEKHDIRSPLTVFFRVKSRPRIGCVPSIGNKSHDTPAPRYRSGSPLPSAIVRLRPLTAAMVGEYRVGLFPITHVEIRQAGCIGVSALLPDDEDANRDRCRDKVSAGTPSMRLKIVAFRPDAEPEAENRTVANPLLRERLRRGVADIL